MVYNRSLSVAESAAVRGYLYTKWGIASNASRPSCASQAADSVTVGRFPLAVNPSVFWHVVGQSTAANDTVVTQPQQAYNNARNRAIAIGNRIHVESSDLHLNAAASIAAAAVDGLYRTAPSVFVHGAMAWDVPLVGWRSEYGGT